MSAPALALAALLCGSTTPPDTLYVGPGLLLDTIQKGVNLARNGDCVMVLPGTYRESIRIVDKGLSLIGYGGPEETIIVRGGGPYDFALQTEPHTQGNLAIEGFRFTGLGGLMVYSWLLYGDLRFRDCRASGIGSGVDNGTLLTVNANQGNVEIENCVTVGNYSGGDGCGIKVFTAKDVTTRHCWFERNWTGPHPYDTVGGGGLSAYSLKATLVEGNVFLKNDNADPETEHCRGGGCAAHSDSIVAVLGNAFVGNVSGQGGALTIWCQVTERSLVERNLFIGNVATPTHNDQWGDGPLAGEGGAIDVGFVTPVVISHNTFYGNRVTTDNNPRRSDPLGAAILSWGINCYVGSNLFVGNRGAEAIYLHASSVELSHNLLFDNPGGNYGGVPGSVHDEIHADPRFFAPAAGDFRLRPDSPAIGAADPDPPVEARSHSLDIGALPFDGDDPALLYVVPHRARRPAGGRLELRVLIANLGAPPLASPLHAELLRPGDSTPLWSRQQTVRMTGEDSWSGQVSLSIPPALPPGDYRLRLRWEDEVEQVRLQIVPSVAHLRAQLERSRR